MTGLRRLRLSLGLSLRDVAEGLEPKGWESWVCDVELGKVTPTPKTLARLAVFYGLTPLDVSMLLREEDA